MPETTERIGQYDVRIEFCAPAEREDHHQRRADALTAWLLAAWDRQHKEVEHGAAHVAV